MERAVIVHDHKPQSSGFFLDLPDLLPLFEPDGHAWSWALRDVPEFAGVWRWDFNLPFVEEEARRDPRGLVFSSFEELQAFGDRCGQIIWGQFVAAVTPGALPRRAVTDAVVGETAVAGLTAFDSSYWFVGGPAAVIDRVRHGFREVEDIDPADWWTGE